MVTSILVFYSNWTSYYTRETKLFSLLMHV